MRGLVGTLALASLLAMTGCGGGSLLPAEGTASAGPGRTASRADVHDVVYQVTADAQGSSIRIEFNDQNGDMRDVAAATVPWSQRFRTAAVDSPVLLLTVTADMVDALSPPSVSCDITVDGRTVDHQDGAIVAACSADLS